MAFCANTTEVLNSREDLGARPAPWLLVFDLDGTLIDSSTDLCNAVNAALIHVHRSVLPPSTITAFIGDGAANVVRRSLRASTGSQVRDPRVLEDEALFDAAFPFFLRFYAEHKLDHTRIYEGVLPTLS